MCNTNQCSSVSVFDIHLPEIGTRRSIRRHSIAQFYRESGISQQGMIHPDLLLSEVNAMSLQAQITYIALDSGFVNKFVVFTFIWVKLSSSTMT